MKITELFPGRSFVDLDRVAALAKRGDVNYDTIIQMVEEIMLLRASATMAHDMLMEISSLVLQEYCPQPSQGETDKAA